MGRPQASALVGQGRGVAKGGARFAVATVRPATTRPATTKGSGLRAARGEGLTVARPGTAPWPLAQRQRDQTKGLWGPGGSTESDRGHQKGCVASPSGNRTPVSRVTGGDTHHYTNEDGGDSSAARPVSGCLPTPPPAQHGSRPNRAPNQPPRSQRQPPSPARNRSVVGKVTQSPVLFQVILQCKLRQVMDIVLILHRKALLLIYCLYSISYLLI